MTPESKTFISAVSEPTTGVNAAFWFAFAGNKLLCDEQSPEVIPRLIDFAELGLEIIGQQYLGTLDDIHCYSVELVPDALAPQGMRFRGLRGAFGLLSEELFEVAGRAIQIVDWDRTHQYCGRCGAKTVTLETERAKQCPECKLLNYPRLSPAVIVSVRRGSELLLARAPNWPNGMYSVLAGFVEPGESLEQAVHREVLEEVGVSIKNVKYFGSQPWPFPNSLMIGFTAEYESGEIQPDPAEIEDAGWYTADHLPNIPPKMSISRHLIDTFIDTLTDEG